MEHAVYRHAQFNCQECEGDVAGNNNQSTFYKHTDGCGATIEKMIEKYFDIVWENARMEDAFGRLSTLLHRFFWPPTGDDMKALVKEVTLDNETLDDGTFPDFVDTMRNTFSALQLSLSNGAE